MKVVVESIFGVSMSDNKYIDSSKEINQEIQKESSETLLNLSLGGLVNAQSLTLLNNTQNMYASQNIANSTLVATCAEILKA